MLHGINEQMAHLRRGFTDLVRIDLKSFAVADLHVALSGLSTISMHDWRKNTQIAAEFGTAKNKLVIDMFWEPVITRSTLVCLTCLDILARSGTRQRSSRLTVCGHTLMTSPTPGLLAK